VRHVLRHRWSLQAVAGVGAECQFLIRVHSLILDQEVETVKAERWIWQSTPSDARSDRPLSFIASLFGMNVKELIPDSSQSM
jgi:hypothetical protein